MSVTGTHALQHGKAIRDTSGNNSVGKGTPERPVLQSLANAREEDESAYNSVGYNAWLASLPKDDWTGALNEEEFQDVEKAEKPKTDTD